MKRTETEAEKLTVLEHLQELRSRLFRALFALFLGIGIGLLLTKRVIDFLIRPVQDHVIVLSPIEGPLKYFEVTLSLGLIIALPFIVYQIYAFARPGLYPQERKVVLFAIPGVVLFFLLGTAFTLLVLIPLSMPMLSGFLGDLVTPTYSLDEYLSFVTTLLLWMGLLFQTPLVLYVLARLGIINPHTLKRARRMVIFLAAVVAAVITPTHDPVTMTLVLVPFVALYELGVLLTGLAMKQRSKVEEA